MRAASTALPAPEGVGRLRGDGWLTPAVRLAALAGRGRPRHQLRPDSGETRPAIREAERPSLREANLEEHGAALSSLSCSAGAQAKPPAPLQAKLGLGSTKTWRPASTAFRPTSVRGGPDSTKSGDFKRTFAPGFGRNVACFPRMCAALALEQRVGMLACLWRVAEAATTRKVLDNDVRPH